MERALGGAQLLVELLDPTGSGVADAQSVQDILDLASNEVASYIQRLIDVATIPLPYPRILVLKTADVAAFYAWSRGTQRQAVPDPAREAYDAAIRWATDVGEGRATLAVAPQAGLNSPPAGVVDYDASTGGVSIAGFKRGYR